MTFPGHFFKTPSGRSPDALQTKPSPGSPEVWQPYMLLNNYFTTEVYLKGFFFMKKYNYLLWIFALYFFMRSSGLL